MILASRHLAEVAVFEVVSEDSDPTSFLLGKLYRLLFYGLYKADCMANEHRHAAIVVGNN